MISPTPTTPHKHWMVRLARTVLLGILLVVVLFVCYTWVVLSWSYSRGERAGYVQKFSKKGWVVKTWEGELAMVAVPGATPDKFYFTVKADSSAAKINAAMGRKVALTYEQHVGLPSSMFGETEYFVTDARVIE